MVGGIVAGRLMAGGHVTRATFLGVIPYADMIQIKVQLFTCIRGTLAGLALLASVAATPGSAVAQEMAQRLPAIQIHAGMHNIHAEVAQTPEQRQIGLMNRKSMAGNDGMLFVFEQQAGHCFWMKNTLIPLSIAFVADDGTIVNVADMQPQSEASHCPEKPVRYALEMNQGWFAKRGFKAGMQLGGAPFSEH
jgi:uncharacterized membrane protein (UPF0127 family)